MINRLVFDLNNMKMMLNAFDGEYFVQNFQIYGGTEYIREHNKKTNEYTITCLININGVKKIYKTCTDKNLETAVCTCYMNASGYTGEYTLNKIIEEVT